MLKMKASMETEAYIGANGHFVIKQKDYCDEDHIVLLSYEQAMAIVDYIQKNEHELKDVWNNSIESDFDLKPLESKQNALDLG